MNRVLLLFVFAVLFGNTVFSTQRPRVYVDRGACPFECCVYRRWVTRTTPPIYASPSARAPKIAALHAGEAVQALTGFVRTKGVKFRVTKDHGNYRRGDTIWVYTSYGEGVFLVWYEDRMYQESLGFSPYGGGAGKRCENTQFCWGELERELEFEWWVKVRLKDGRIGWTNRARDYGNTDACG